MPAQPYPERFAPKSPSSAICGTSSIGKDPSRRTCSWIRGRNSRVTQSRTVSRASRSSSESSSSRRRKSSPWKLAMGRSYRFAAKPRNRSGPEGGASGPDFSTGWKKELRGGSRAVRALAAPHLLHLLVDGGDLPVDPIQVARRGDLESVQDVGDALFELPGCVLAERFEPLHRGVLLELRAQLLGALLELLALRLDPLLELLALRREPLLDVLAAGLEALLDLLAAGAQFALHALELGSDRAVRVAHAVDAVLEEVGGLGHGRIPRGRTRTRGAICWGVREWMGSSAPEIPTPWARASRRLTRRNLTRCVNASRSRGVISRNFCAGSCLSAARSEPHDRAGPREARSEARHRHELTRPDPARAHALVEQHRDRGGRAVAVAVDVRRALFRWDPELLCDV